MRRPGTTISIPMDEVRVVAFSQPVQTVYVGNPLIADITMIDSKHAFLLGKGFGATNIIALNSDGKQVVNDTVSVFGHTGNLVILHRGAAQATYACSGARCEIAPTPGDDKDYYASRTEQLANHQDGLLKAASAGR
ncbi:MAG TPA: pilus assembly protein N-terminal domain-containing protein [Rhizomicrobium sp.]|nr:pilus assembly protein N-terminal domain-containing protein [Rhizomicrobium sp.]